ncbi:MAG: endonuclease/exonuclease/phosphatase family protein [Parachlamydiales bacterium]|jgi:endonuclease/exonuclease/phosphatase family metal-dependent hydrolase
MATSLEQSIKVRFCQVAPHIEKIAYKHDIKGKENFKNLTETISKIRDILASSFYSAARFFVNPHWKITDVWLNTISNNNNDQTSTTQKVLSTTKSVFTTLGLLPFALGGLILGQVCHFSAFLLSTTPYIHLKNEANLKPLDKLCSLLQLNCCLTAGGFSKLFGGTVIPNDERVSKIAEMIKQNDPDLVCLQEVSDIKDAFKLYNELSNKYGDFYFNIGSTPFILQNNSGLFVASKTALENPQVHSFSDISGTESMANKCFFIFSTNNANFVTTHLSPSHDDLNPTNQESHVREEEQQRIRLASKQRSSDNKKPTYVSGDFNINWNSDQYQKGLLFAEGKDYYNNNRSESLSQDATCETEYLVDRNWHHKKDVKPQHLILDYFLSLFDSNATSVKTRKIATFDTDKPQEAISDHSALISTIKL